MYNITSWILWFWGCALAVECRCLTTYPVFFWFIRDGSASEMKNKEKNQQHRSHRSLAQAGKKHINFNKLHICHFHNDIGQLMLAFALLFLFFFFFRPLQARRKFEWHQLANTEHQVHITWTPYFAGIYSFVSVIGLPQTILIS